MKIKYTPYSNAHHTALIEMINDLYHVSDEGEVMTPQKIESTISYLSSHIESGKILLMMYEEKVIGYAILIYYCSNEYGGSLLFLDELYIKEAYRSKGVGKDFLDFLFEKMKKEFKAIILEVFPYNKRAYDFYIRQGFVQHESNFLKYKF
jgi:ribosomal protein S18 acetylase RimI-like enzyme